MKGVYDSRLLRFEVYNPNDFDVIFQRIAENENYVRNAGISLGPVYVTCKAKGFAILNHSFYLAHGKNLQHGEPIQMIRKYGKAIGDGTTLPSLPMLE